jgi:hypothetical protein
MNYRWHDSRIPVSTHSYPWTDHIYAGMGNELAAWVWCATCDTHARHCPELAPKGGWA